MVVALRTINHLTVNGIAKHLGIHRSYFAAIFKEHTHMSPQAFLLWVRMSKAKELLSDEKLSVLSITHSVGYEDALLFSRTFKNKRDFPRASTAKSM